MTYITKEVLPGLEVEFFGQPTWQDKGIGPYEFWGQKAVDKQMVAVMEDDIEWNKKLYDDDQNAMISEYADYYYNIIGTEMEEKFVDNYDGPDEPDYDPDDYDEYD
jgi:hypothetical protein